MKRKLFAILLILALMLGLAACNTTSTDDSAGPGGASEPGSSSAPGSSTAPGSSGGGSGGDPVEITLAFNAIPNGLDPISEDLLVNMCISNDIYDRLLTRDSEMNLLPGVAKTWTQVDGMTWEFEIDMNLVFSNGEPVTMEDVVYSVTRLKDIPKSLDVGNVIESVTYEGNVMTVKFTEVNNILLARLVSYFILVNKAHVEAGGDDAIYLNPISTAPYKVTQFIPGTTVVLETWDGYAYDKPQIDKITYIAIPETATRYIAVETGQAHYAALVTALERDLAERDPNLSVIISPSFRSIHISFNNEFGPASNVNIRRALAHAIDRDSMCALLGGRPPVRSLLFGGYPDLYMDPPGQPDFDLDKARELLEAEGYGPGNPLQLELIYSPVVDPSIELYQSHLASIGVDVTLTQLEFSVYLDRENAGEFDLMFTSGTNRGGHPLTDLDRFDKNLIGSRNISRFSNDRAQELLERMRVTQDAQEMRTLSLELNTILGEEVPNVGIYLQPLMSVAAKGLEGVILRPDQQQSFRYCTYNP